MDDGDHEDTNEDSNDRGHHVVHSCPHPHPPCCLVIQGCHTWRTGGATLSSIIHTPPPSLPIISSISLIPPAQQEFTKNLLLHPTPAPTLPSFDPSYQSSTPILFSKYAFHPILHPKPHFTKLPLLQPELFNSHPTLHLCLLHHNFTFIPLFILLLTPILYFPPVHLTVPYL